MINKSQNIFIYARKRENLTGVSSDKKILTRNLTKLITILVSGKYNTIEKIKKIVRIAIQTAFKLWREPKKL